MGASLEGTYHEDGEFGPTGEMGVRIAFDDATKQINEEKKEGVLVQRVIQTADIWLNGPSVALVAKGSGMPT